MEKIRKRSDLRKGKWGSLSIQESKIAVKFSKWPSIRTVTSLRDISEKNWIHSYPIMVVNFAFRRKAKMTATCSFVSFGDKMRELLVKLLLVEKKEKKREEKKRENYWSHDGIKKGAKFSRCVAVFLGEAEWKLTKLVSSKFQPLNTEWRKEPNFRQIV